MDDNATPVPAIDDLTSVEPVPDRHHWRAFTKSHPAFLSSFHNAYEHLRLLVLNTEIEVDDFAHLVATQILVTMLDDLDCVMTLCCADKTTGAHKLLRSVFERLITAKYVAANPTEAQRYMEFQALDWRKFKIRYEKENGEGLSIGDTSNLDKAYETAKDHFPPDKCSECARRFPRSWTKLDTGTMAGLVGMGGNYLFCFLIPTFLLHSTYWGVNRTLEDTAKGDSTALNLILQSVHTLLIEGIRLHYSLTKANLTPLFELMDQWRVVWLANDVNVNP